MSYSPIESREPISEQVPELLVKLYSDYPDYDMPINERIEGENLDGILFPYELKSIFEYLENKCLNIDPRKLGEKELSDINQELRYLTIVVKDEESLQRLVEIYQQLRNDELHLPILQELEKEKEDRFFIAVSCCSNTWGGSIIDSKKADKREGEIRQLYRELKDDFKRPIKKFFEEFPYRRDYFRFYCELLNNENLFERQLNIESKVFNNWEEFLIDINNGRSHKYRDYEDYFITSSNFVNQIKNGLYQVYGVRWDQKIKKDIDVKFDEVIRKELLYKINLFLRAYGKNYHLPYNLVQEFLLIN